MRPDFEARMRGRDCYLTWEWQKDLLEVQEHPRGWGRMGELQLGPWWKHPE